MSPLSHRFALLVALFATPALAQLEFEREPILYETAKVNDPVARLQAELDAGKRRLKFDDEHGYLPALLEALAIDVESQVLVFSKSSLQIRHITPRRPRAIYFNDDVAIGWVQRGDVIEVMSNDPMQGDVFYTLAVDETDSPKFVRDRGRCLTCHASSRTQGVPGGLVRSMLVDRGGQPLYGSGTYVIDHRSPFERRWGGYYVTGTHGRMRHLGNATSTTREARIEDFDREPGANVTKLDDLVDVSPYLAPHSDIVALMVLEHQTQMHNAITRANFETRSAVHYDGVMNAAFDRPADHRSDTSRRRIASVGDRLLKLLLFSDEAKLTSEVKGTSGFAERFTARGKRDEQGRSLRDFDLKTRMFRHPCSYLIHSPAFNALPKPVMSHVTTRLRAILNGEDDDKAFSHLTVEDRRAIREILSETNPKLWKQAGRSKPGARE